MRTVNTARNKPKPSKIQQQVTVNKVQQSGTVTPTSPTTNAVTTHTTRSAHATQIPVKTRPQVTSINTEPRLTPLGRVGLGVYNTGSDYANILNTDYEDKSILNQAIGHAFEGKWDKAGQVIQNNPYRFAGNLAVEAGAALIPIGMILRGAKIGSTVGKVVSKIKPNKGGGELKEFYAGGQYTQKEIEMVEKLVKEHGGGKKLTQNDFDKLMDKTPAIKEVEKRDFLGKEIFPHGGLSPEEISKLNKLAKKHVALEKSPQMSAREKDKWMKQGQTELPKNYRIDEAKAVRSKLVAQSKVAVKPRLSVIQKKIIKNETLTATINFDIAFGKKISPSGRKHLFEGFKKKEYDSLKKYKRTRKSEFEKNQLKREHGSNEPNLGARKDGIFRTSLRYGRSGRKKDNVFEQSYDPDMAKKWAGLGLGLGGAGVIGGVGLSETDSKKNKDKSLGGYGQFL